MSGWIDHTIWWHVYPLGFAGAPIRPTAEERALSPRLDRLLSWLDYLIELGANGLALGPIFQSESHGYDTLDFYRIDSRLGDDATFDHLARACRERGIHLMLDGVFNHVGVGHPRFQAALAGNDPAAEAMFRIHRTEAGVHYDDFEGHQALPALNHDSPAVVNRVVDVMCHWLRRGASAWRLDAAYAVKPEFWAQVLPRVRAEFPDTWIVGEVIHGDYPDIVRRSGMDSVTQYELWKAAWSAPLEGNFFELDWCLKRHNDFLASFVPMTFIGNHDVTRIASRIGNDKAALAATILFTVGGIPSIYYGDEQAFQGIKTDREGGDDEVRPAFPDTPAALSPLGEPMRQIHHDLIGLRRRNPWLVNASTTPTQVEARTFVYDVNGREGQRLNVALRLDPSPMADISAADGTHLLHVGA